MTDQTAANLPRRVTLATVAHEAGVSPSTVSLVLNDRPLAQNLAEETRLRIRAVAERMHYRPNAAARSLRSARTQLIGVIVFDIADPYCTLILKGVQDAVGASSLLPIIMDAGNQQQQFERYLGMAVERQVEGLIVVANWLFVDLKVLARFERSGIPAVVVGREFPSETISSVLVDNQAGGRAALNHLLQLGHRKLAVIRGPRQLQDSERRWRGIQESAKAAGLKLHPKLIAQLPESADPVQGYSGGYEAAMHLLRSGESFTGVLAFDDLTACGAIRALHEAGLRVPEDVSVVGFDDIPQAALNTPSLTTVSQRMRAMGAEATQHLLSLLGSGGSAKPFVRLDEPAIVARESSGPAPVDASHLDASTAHVRNGRQHR